MPNWSDPGPDSNPYDCNFWDVNSSHDWRFDDDDVELICRNCGCRANVNAVKKTDSEPQVIHEPVPVMTVDANGHFEVRML